MKLRQKVVKYRLTTASCLTIIRELRWFEGMPTCPCGYTTKIKEKKEPGRALRYRCGNPSCTRAANQVSFSAVSGTFLEGVRNLPQWFAVMELMFSPHSNQKEQSAAEIRRLLPIRYATIFEIMKKIKDGPKSQEDPKLIEGIAQHFLKNKTGRLFAFVLKPPHYKRPNGGRNQKVLS